MGPLSSEEELEKQLVRERIQAAVADVWKQSRPKLQARLELLMRLLELAVADPQARRDAHAEAHALAGTVGTFGLREGSEIAREVENRLLAPGALTEADRMAMSASLGRLGIMLAAE